jgi:hypothetical protein
MAVGKASNFKIYDELVVGSMIERQVQNIDAWNAASKGALVLSSKSHLGNYSYESFFQKVTLVSRRDTTSMSAATDTPITMGENVTVKINRKIGPVAHNLDAFKKIGKPANENSVSVALGQQVSDDMTADMLNTGLLALVAGINNNSAVKYVGTASTITTVNLVNALAKFGDQAQRVVAWVMHSKVFYDLVKEQIGLNITGVSNFNIAQASPITLNRPVIVTDSAALKNAGASAGLDTYNTLGVVAGAMTVEDSEEQTFVSQLITGLENLAYRYQGEYAFNIGLKGYTWDVANGGSNPNDTAVNTGSNWDKTSTYDKDTAGIILTTK